ELTDNLPETIQFLQQHAAFFTFAENYGDPDCSLPISSRFDFKPTRQPVIIDLWRPYANGTGAAFTTIGNWRQARDVTWRGEVYHWSKHLEFNRFLELPARSGQAFELALSRCGVADRTVLEANGWTVRDALTFSMDLEAYRCFIATSRGEFTVAKDQNVRFRTGWFSDRGATYLAAGRPVITQDTGFDVALPVGEALFPFTTIDDAAAAIEAIEADYAKARQAAFDVAREHFDSGVVLGRLLETV